jgi:hypothetical protein
MNKKILRSKEQEIAKAGRLIFDAIFGDSREFQERVGEELDDEAAARDPNVITVHAESIVRCAGCAREQTIPTNVDVRVLERQGWRFGAGEWRCPFCPPK